MSCTTPRTYWWRLTDPCFRRENQVWSFSRDVATVRAVAQEIFQLHHEAEALRSLAHIDLENSGVVIHELLYLVLNMSG